MEVLGVDIGGSGIKAAPVDVTAGALTRERIKVPTPQPSKPEVVADEVRGLVGQFGWSGKAGITFPGVVTDGVIRTAAMNRAANAEQARRRCEAPYRRP